MNVLQKVRQLTDQIRTGTNGLEVVDAWALAERLIGRMPVDAAEAQRVFKEKDAEGLDALVRALESPSVAKAEPAVEVSEREMNDALRMFRKRIKLARLNDESKLGGHGMTSGKKSGIASMEAPREVPRHVWKALARAGKLIDEGHGFYSLPPERPAD
ncbi:MAG: hypothetical protein ACIARR_11400 [Phycisphaerales bacterium JB059]